MGYSLDLSGHIGPEILPIQNHLLAGTISPDFRIANLAPEVESLDLTITLELTDIGPLSGEVPLCSVDLTGNSLAQLAAVPKPPSLTLAAVWESE